jgi:hypothetical protein
MSGESSSDIPDPAADGYADADARHLPHGYELSDPNDSMSPPKEPCECWCMCCRRTFMSTEIWFQRVLNDPAGFSGFWMCPTPNCGGAGFNFEIFPTDPEHPANKEWVHFDDDDDDANDDEYAEDELPDELEAMEPDGEWDPGESKWKELDELFGGEEDDDDLEGEEWKYGLQPGERPTQFGSAGDETQIEDFDEDERRYDEPDRRPREVDWSDREDRGGWREDDIPF